MLRFLPGAILQTHRFPVALPYGEDSQVTWSLKPSKKAIVFVHGFGGSATNTWVQFPSLLQQDNRTAGYDLIFYGYDGLTTRASYSAKHLADFLEKLSDYPAQIFSNSLKNQSRPNDFKYESILIVAHSLGAIVSRYAALDGVRNNKTWPNSIRFIFFAPAHRGAQIIKLAAQALGILRFVPVEALAKHQFQVLQDLEPGNDTLVDLEQYLKDALAKGLNNLSAKKVFHTGMDRVVEPRDFYSDPPYEPIDHADHREICKPRAGFMVPLEMLLAEL